MATDNIDPSKLIFVICAPRSGSTLLQRMIASHTTIYTHPEPHLITPLAYLGYYNTVGAAPFDHINAAEALRELVQELPRGEDDYLDALRAYSSTMYARVLAPTGRAYFLDKTPAYALVLPFLLKLYPTAKYVVLTRHPLAILHSQVHSFFNGDYAAAMQQNPIVRDYVPAIAQFMRRASFVHVQYEALVTDPSSEMQRISSYLGVNFEEGMVEYGRQQHISKSYGDPMAVEKHSRPVRSSVEKWAQDLAAKPMALDLTKRLVAELEADDLKAWGYPCAQMFSPVEDLKKAGKGEKTHAPMLSSYRLKRALMLNLRKHTQGPRANNALRKIRYYCDVLLRE